MLLKAERITVYYLLIQGDRVLDITNSPMGLMWSLLDINEDFSVVMGVRNEFGKLEIISPIADYYTGSGSDVWLLTSPLDGEDRVINSAGGACSALYSRLETLYVEGRFDDPCDFDYILLVEADDEV